MEPIHDMPKSKSKRTRILLKVTAIILAWVSVPLIGIFLLLVTSAASITSGSSSPVTVPSLNAILGIILILIIIILTNSHRKKSYVFHIRIGLFIGLGIYSVMFGLGAWQLVQQNIMSSPGTANVCSSPRQQFNYNSAAVVPIETNLGYGTGFAVLNQTTILTAYHVIEGSSSIKANYASGSIGMTVIDTAPQYDLALLTVDEPTGAYFTLSHNYMAGDEVLAYGYPGNALSAGAPSLSGGIVSRELTTEDLRMTSSDIPSGLVIIQTDAAINPGNSGGPLIGSCGVIGIVSFTSDTGRMSEYFGSVSEQNIGFAISAKTAKSAFPKYFE